MRCETAGGHRRCTPPWTTPPRAMVGSFDPTRINGIVVLTDGQNDYADVLLGRSAHRGL